MVMVKAVRGLRPKKELAAKVASPPYDVLSADEARVLAADNPISFLYVEKMEISLPPGADPDGDRARLQTQHSCIKLVDCGVDLFGAGHATTCSVAPILRKTRK